MAQKEIHLRDYLAIIKKHDFIIIVSFLLILGSALVVGLHIPKTYEASALILVHPSANGNVSSDSVFRNILSGGANSAEMETLAKRLSTKSLLTSVIESLEQGEVKGVDYLPPIGALRKIIRADIVPDTRYINVSIRLREQEGGERNAALVVNKSIEQLQNVLNEERSSKAHRQMDILDRLEGELKSDLETRQQELLQFMKQNGIPNIWYEQLSQKLTRRDKYLELKEQILVNLSNAQVELDKLQTELANYPEFRENTRIISDNPVWMDLITGLNDIEVQIAGAKERLGPEKTQLKGLEAQKQELEAKLHNLAKTTISSITETLSPIHLSLLERKMDIEFSSIRAKNAIQQYDVLSAEIDKELAELYSVIPEKQFLYNQFAGVISELRDIKKELYKRKIDAKLFIDESEYDGLHSEYIRPKGGISVIDAAEPEKIPVSPRLFFITFVAAVIGIFVGLAVALMSEYFDNTYHSPEDAKHDLDIPILGIVPMIKSQKQVTPALPMIDETSSVAENYRALAANIDFACHDIEHQAIMIASSHPDENASYTVANLGIAMAQTGKSVIIIDCNFKQPIQHQIFDVSGDVGLSHLLLGDDIDISSAIHNTGIPNLNIIPSGPGGTPLNLSKIPHIIEQLKSSYDFILCDGPPILHTPEGIILASRLNGIMLFVNLEQTSKDILRRSKEQLNQPGITLLGLICSGRDNQYLTL